jgi:hypothetical protein
LGFTVAFHGGDHGKSTVYIYDKSLSGIPDEPMSELVLEEFNKATRDVLAMAEFRPARNIMLTDRYGTGDPGREREFLVLNSSWKIRSRRSFLYLTGACGRLVKI